MWHKVSHQYMFICTKCKEIIFHPELEKVYCPICDKEMHCLGYISQKHINEVRENIKKWWLNGFT